MPSRGQTSNKPPARFVVVEGLDGTGTTTVARALADELRARDLGVRLTAEPTDGAFGQLLRRHLAGELTLGPSTTALVFTADRSDHLQGVVRPALARGEWVVSDRYLLSTLAYQGAEGVDRQTILDASATFEVPDVTFVLDAPDEMRQARMSSRDRTERYEDPEIADRLRVAYAESVALLRSLGHRIEVIDATAPAADVVAEILRRLDAAS